MLSLTDWVGASGVSILLIAFLLNLLKRISQDSASYILMNLLGAGLACLASVLLNYWPFIVLEGVWMAVSAFALVRRVQKNL